MGPIRFQYRLSFLMLAMVVAACLGTTWRYSAFPWMATFLVGSHLVLAGVACFAFGRLVNDGGRQRP